MTILTTKLSSYPCIIADDLLAFNPNGPLSSFANTLSGSFTYPSGKSPCSILINQGKSICSSACHGWLSMPETVIYRYKDGTFGIAKCISDRDIPTRENLLWAVGGMGLCALYNPAEEGFTKFTKDGKSYDYSDVLRKTAHTVLAIKDEKCHLLYLPGMTGSQVNAFCTQQNLRYAIMLDGGHIAAINGAEPFSKINTSQRQGYALQAISKNNPPSGGLAPPAPSPDKNAPIVILDSGHSEVVAGKRSFDSTFFEYEFNLDVSKRIAEHLTRHNVKSKIIQIKNTNLTQELNERIRLANTSGADLLVSIHANAFGSDWNSAKGWEIYSYKLTGESQRLAKAIHTTSIPYLGLSDRKIKDGSSFAMVRDTKMPAVLIEHGFYTNKEELAKLTSNEFRTKCSIADAKGILGYLAIPWRDEDEKAPVPSLPDSDSGSTSPPSLYRIQTGAFKEKNNALNMQQELEKKGYPATIVKTPLPR